MQANIELHSKLAEHYQSCEPHFRQENVSKVKSRFEGVITSVPGYNNSTAKMLDLGCGTGFMINVARDLVSEIDGVDITQAMLDRVDTQSGRARIKLHNSDTGTFPVRKGDYDVVTAYSFLHHLFDIKPTLNTAYAALKEDGKFYVDLEPNYFFWESINALKRDGNYDPIVKREIEAVTYKDEDIEKQFGLPAQVFNQAEYMKNILGGFKEEEILKDFHFAGFKKVELFYHWFLGQGTLINDDTLDKEKRFESANIMHNYLTKALPITKHLFKYFGIVAQK